MIFLLEQTDWNRWLMAFAFWTESVNSFPSCLMDELNSLVVSFLMFDVDLKTFQCIIIVFSGVSNIFGGVRVAHPLLLCLYFVSLRSEFRVVMSVTISANNVVRFVFTTSCL